MSKLILIDGNSLLFRAYYATAAAGTVNIMRRQDGFPTNAIYSLTNIVQRILQTEKPDYAFVAFDTPKPTFRHEQYKDYKGTRKGMPDELAAQMPIIKKVLEAMNGKPVTHKYVTITGEVNDPRTFYAPIGSKIYGLIKRCGGSTIEDPAILIGGPMMGFIGNDQDVVTKTTNAVILLPKNHPVILRKRTKVGIDLKRAMAACCQCNYCTDMCPRHLLGHPINPAEFMRVVSNNDHTNTKAYMNIKYCSA